MKRLRGYDYAQPGAYFVTICTQHRECLFGDVIEGEMVLNDAGRMVQITWEQIPQWFPTIELDASIVMPNHFHAIVVIVGAPLVGAPLVDARPVGAHPVDAQDRAGTRPAPTLGAVIGAFKSITTNSYIRGVHEQGWPSFDRRAWQRNYYEYIIHNETALAHIRDYIETNPLRWALDRDNTNRRHRE